MTPLRETVKVDAQIAALEALQRSMFLTTAEERELRLLRHRRDRLIQKIEQQAEALRRRLSSLEAVMAA